MPTTNQTGERLARIETLLEAIVETQADFRADIKAIRADLDNDKAELAALKNKGAGLLIGVGLAGGSIGAVAAQLLDRFFH